MASEKVLISSGLQKQRFAKTTGYRDKAASVCDIFYAGILRVAFEVFHKINGWDSMVGRVGGALLDSRMTKEGQGRRNDASCWEFCRCVMFETSLKNCNK